MEDLLDFEIPVAALEAELKTLNSAVLNGTESDAVKILRKKIDQALEQTFSNLEPWQKLALARHPKRPHGLDFVHACFDDFDALSGDRYSGECHAIVGGVATLNDKSVMVIAQQKGRNTDENLRVNFGMPKPCGYRKVKRLMQLAQKYAMPVVTFLDSPGADAGVDAELANQSEAIASNMLMMSELRVPIISVVIGEAMSGGAMAMGVADYLFMLEYAVFSVISPEGCAAILWRDAALSKQAANIMGITADALYEKQLIDEIIAEPAGGAHRDYDKCFLQVRNAITPIIDRLYNMDIDDLLSKRYHKWMLPSLAE